MVDELYADRFQPSLHESLGTLHELQVFLDGHFLSGEEARLSVWDHALFYGDGIFEGIRAYNGRVFKLEEHLTRLWNSAKAMALAIPLSQDEMSHVIRETLHRNGLQEAHIRAIVTRGTGRPGLDPRRAVRPSVLVLAYPFPPQLGGKPVRVILSSIRRKSPHSIDSRIKSLNYLDSILAKLQATASGADDAIMLDVSGCICEATGENIFIVSNDALVTPPTTACLPGVTRGVIMDLAQRMGIAVSERALTPGDLYVADEVFLTGTGAEVVPVGEVDGRIIGDECPGPVTIRLTADYRDAVRASS